MSAHPKKRGSQRGPQKQEKARGSEPAPRPPPLQRTGFRASRPPSGHATPQATPLPPAQVPVLPPLTPPPLVRPRPFRRTCGTGARRGTSPISARPFAVSGVCGSRRAVALSAMGVPKRKAPGGQDGAVPRAGAAKRARSEELTGVRFKAQLRDPQGVEPGECRGPAGAESTCERGGFRPRPCARLTPPLCRCSVRSHRAGSSGLHTGKPRPLCLGILGPGRPGPL